MFVWLTPHMYAPSYTGECKTHISRLFMRSETQMHTTNHSKSTTRCRFPFLLANNKSCLAHNFCSFAWSPKHTAVPRGVFINRRMYIHVEGCGGQEFACAAVSACVLFWFCSFFVQSKLSKLQVFVNVNESSLWLTGGLTSCTPPLTPSALESLMDGFLRWWVVLQYECNVEFKDKWITF